MMFSKRSPVLRAMAFVALILYVTAAASTAQRHDHELLEDKDLTDLLDADLDAPFSQQPHRHLQEEEMTQAPTSAPTTTPTDSEDLDGERGFVSFAPTPAATSMRDLLTEAPVTSGASSWRPSGGVASALVFVGSVAAAAVMA